MRSVHKYMGHTIIPDTRGWALTYKIVTAPPTYEVLLGVSALEERYETEFFATLHEAKRRVKKIVTEGF